MIQQWAAGLCIALMLCLPAGAQEASTVPTARQLELAREILQATGVEKNYEDMLRSMFLPAFRGSAQLGLSPEASEKTQAFGAAVTEAVLAQKPRMLQLSAEVYAQTFSEEELRQLLAFYQSPLGQTLSRKMPLLARQMGEATAREMPSLMQSMAAHLCAKEDCPQALRDLAAGSPNAQ